MNRSLHLLITVAAAAAVCCLSAYAFLSVQSVAPGRVSAPTIPLVPADGAAISSPAARRRCRRFAPANRERAVVVVSYRDAFARGWPFGGHRASGRHPVGPLPLAPTVLVKGLESGVIVDRDGYIVTNNHVIDGASQLAVALPDGTLHMTRVIGTHPESDLALLKIDVEGLSPITPADINDVAVGDVVLAVGNPLGNGQTVAQGIVSAIVRNGMVPMENFIQTDAAINPATPAAR